MMPENSAGQLKIRFRGASLVGLSLLVLAGTLVHGQQPTGPVKVTIQDGNEVAQEEQAIPVDPTIRIRPGFMNQQMSFGLTVDGKRITFQPQGSIWLQARIDGQEVYVGQGAVQQKPLKAGPFGKARHGTQSTWVFNNLHFTQVVEVVPGKPSGKPAAGQKRRMDTCRILYSVENKDQRAHKIELRTGIDTLIVNNDGALFASPTTHAGKILDGVDLRDKAMPAYVQVLERPDLQNPGFVATMTLKMGSKIKGPNRVVLTSLRNFGPGWDLVANKANGDSAVALYYDPLDLKPGGKAERGWAYGGGIAGNPENDGLVRLVLGGSLEPNKLFTITAFVEDPVPGQTLTLKLPDSMDRVEGKEVQPVPPPDQSGTSLVLWKARVLRTGAFDLRVRSSTGVTQLKKITISR